MAKVLVKYCEHAIKKSNLSEFSAARSTANGLTVMKSGRKIDTH